MTLKFPDFEGMPLLDIECFRNNMRCMVWLLQTADRKWYVAIDLVWCSRLFGL